MNQFRIMADNYAFSSNTNLLASSENPRFPVSNLKKFNRANVWRSSGYFVITANNQDLDFDIGGGEVTATIPVGNYSTSELIEQIETQMAAAGTPDVFTVTQVLGRWRISSDGSSLDLLRNTGTNVATSIWSTIGYGVDADSTGALEYTGAAIAIHTEEGVVVDLNTSEQIDSIAVLLNPMNSDYILSDTAEVTLQASATNSWDNPPFEQLLTIDDEYDVYTHFLEDPETYRYWRIRIIDPQNANLCVEISKIFLSLAVQIQGPEIGFVHSINDQSKMESNDYGHVYTDLYPSVRALEFNFAALTEQDTETLWRMFTDFGGSVPICIALDPLEFLFDKDRFFLYGRLNKDFKTVQSFYSYFNASLTLVEAT